MNGERTDGPKDELERREAQLHNFLTKVFRADGGLIALPGVFSRIGEPLFVSVRYGQDVHPALVEEGRYFLAVDVFAESETGYLPVGMRDYEIHNAVANGNKNIHQHLHAPDAAHQAADKHWSMVGVKVDDSDLLNIAMRSESSEEGVRRVKAVRNITANEDWDEKVYQRLGIGSFMTALALKVLEDRGVQAVKFFHVSSAARAMWRKFGHEPKRGVWLHIEDVVNHPYCKESLLKFL